MEFSNIFIGTAVLSVTAIILGIAISIVTQLFYIKIDPRIEEIYEILPHFNCGACGCPGCMPYAENIINNNLDTNKCKPGGVKVHEKILAILEK